MNLQALAIPGIGVLAGRSGSTGRASSVAGASALSILRCSAASRATTASRATSYRSRSRCAAGRARSRGRCAAGTRASRVGLREKTQSPRQRVVVTARARAHSLVEEAQIAWTDGQRLVDVRAHHLSVADAFGPCSSTKYNIGGTSEGVGLGVGKASPCARETSRCPGAEVPRTVTADSLDEKKIFAVANIIYA